MLAWTLKSSMVDLTVPFSDMLPIPGRLYDCKSLNCMANGRRATTRPWATAANSTGREEMVQVDQPRGTDAPIQRSRQRSVPARRRRYDSPLLLLDSWDPFTAGGLTQMIDLMDQLFLDIAPSAGTGGEGATVRAPWEVEEDDKAFYIRVDVPGFSKEDMKVNVEDGVLVIKGEQDPQRKEVEHWPASKGPRKTNTRIKLPDNAQVDKISAHAKNGVLYVVVPKQEESKQLIDVQVS